MLYVTNYHFCCILFVTQTVWEGLSKGQEYPEKRMDLDGLLGSILEVSYHSLVSGLLGHGSHVQNTLNILTSSQGYKR